MSRRNELLAVAERCEKVNNGSRNLDADLYEALGFEVLRVPADSRAIGWRHRPGRGCWQSMQRLTTSLDAAMTLVPEGFMRALGSHNENNQPWACLTEPDGRCRDYAATGADEVLALCAAALRAQAEMES